MFKKENLLNIYSKFLSDKIQEIGIDNISDKYQEIAQSKGDKKRNDQKRMSKDRIQTKRRETVQQALKET